MPLTTKRSLSIDFLLNHHVNKLHIYSEKATKFCEISTLLLSYVVPVKSNVEISQNFVAFSEYINFTKLNGNIKTGLPQDRPNVIYREYKKTEFPEYKLKEFCS